MLTSKVGFVQVDESTFCKSYSVNSSLQITKLKVTFDQYYKYLPANILVVL